MTHKFRIGQLVRLVRSAFPGQSVGGVYEIVRLLPESNGEYGYRIKAVGEPTERAVREHEITSASK